MQERVTFRTNRIDLFCREHLGSDSDETRRNFIRWNYDWFRHSPTFWLPVGRLFWLIPPPSDLGRILALAGFRLVIPPGEYLVIPGRATA